MSIISKPEVTPNRVRSIYEWLIHKKNYEEEEGKLKRYLIPTHYNAINEEKTRHQQFVNAVLNECEELGMMERINGNVRLTNKVIKQYEESRIPFTLMFSDFLFSKDNTRNEDFILALAWLLSIDPFTAPKTWLEFEQAVKEAGVQEITGMSNSNPYGNFIIWTTYLGFSWTHLNLVPDPTEHIRWRIGQHYHSGEELSVATFLDNLIMSVPVLDEGIYRKRIHEVTGDGLAQHELSASISLALKQLEDLDVIQLIKKSDTESRILSKEFSNTSFSHIIVN